MKFALIVMILMIIVLLVGAVWSAVILVNTKDNIIYVNISIFIVFAAAFYALIMMGFKVVFRKRRETELIES